MINLLGLLTALIFLSISLLHVYWAFGSSRNGSTVIPTHNGKPIFTPSPGMTLLVALLLLIAALLVLGTLGYWRAGLPFWLFKMGTWGVAVVLLLRTIGDFRFVGFFKRVRDTAFARNDTLYYSPLCLCLAVSCAAVGLWAAS
jgi:fatty acid desaturase